MASDKVEFNDVMGSSLLKGIKEVNAGLKETLTIQGELIKQGQKGGKTAENIERTNKAVKESTVTRKALTEVEKQQIALQKQLQKASDAEVKGKLKLQAATKAQKDELKDLLILEDKEAGTLEKVAAKSNQLRRERSKLNLETQKGKDRLKEINIQLDKNNQKIIKNSDALKKQKLNVGNYSASVKEGIQTSGLFSRQLFILQKVQATLAIFTKKNVAATEAQAAAQKAAGVASGGFSKALKIVKIALISTGVGAIVIGLGALIAAFAGTQRGANAFAKVLTPIKEVFFTLVGFLEKTAFKAFDKLKAAFEDPQQAIKDLWEAIKTNIINRWNGLLDLFSSTAEILKAVFTLDLDGLKAGLAKAGNAFLQFGTGVEDIVGKITEGFSSMTDAAKKAAAEAIKRGQEMAALAIKLRKDEIRLTTELAQQNLDYRKQLEISQDQLRTDEDRIKALTKAKQIQRDISKNEIGLLEDRLKLRLKEQEANDTSDEELLANAVLQAEIINSKAAAQKKINTLIAQQSSIELRGLTQQNKLISDTIKFVDSIENIGSEDEFIQRTKDSTDKYQALLKKVNENVLIDETKKVELRLLLQQKFSKEIIKIDEDKRLKTKTDNELQVEQDIQLFNRRIKEAELQGLKEGKTAKEISEDIKKAKIEALENEIALRIELGQDVIDLEIQLEKQKLKKIEDLNTKSDKKTAKQKLAEFKKVYDSINSELKTQLDEQFAETNKANSDEIAQTKDNIKTQQDLASKGLDNQLAFEQKKLADAQLKEQEDLRKQQKIKEGIALAEAYLSAFQARMNAAKTQQDIDSAGGKALSDVLLAKGIAQTLVSAFAGYEEGGYTGEYGTSEVAGVVHGKEFVIDAATTKKMGLKGSNMNDFKDRMFSGQMFNHDFMSTDMSSKQAQRYDNTNVVNEIKQLREDFKSRPIQQVDVDRLGNLIETIHKNGVKTVIKYKGSNRI